VDILDTKHESIRVLVTEVLRHLPEAELVIMDWLEGSPYAIGLALRSNPARLAYISKMGNVKGLYLLSCETAPRRDHNIEADPFDDLNALAAAIAAHLGAA